MTRAWFANDLYGRIMVGCISSPPAGCSYCQRSDSRSGHDRRFCFPCGDCVYPDRALYAMPRVCDSERNRSRFHGTGGGNRSAC